MTDLNTLNYTVGDHVVYPTHGVGVIKGIEDQDVGGLSITLLVIEFTKDRMTLRVPTTKATVAGLRRLSTDTEIKAALTKLHGKSRIRKTLWSKRAQEYETKINSGNPVSIAEVVRELYRSPEGDELSYSERQVFQLAFQRLASEVAAVEQIDESRAAEKLEGMLQDVA